MTIKHKCKEAYDLVHNYLNDRSHTTVKPGYTSQPKVQSSVKQKIHQSLQILRETLKDNINEISISYNGGKDCLVMLILILSTIHELGLDMDEDFKLPSVYINSDEPFMEVNKFISDSTKYYHLDSTIIKSDLKSGFQQYLSDNPQINTIIVGIRHSDPYGSELTYKQETDHNWPKFMRIHPILNWTYVEIWEFIIGCGLDYCCLYDKGYTSLGGVHNTIRNPKLQQGEDYLPAYMLTDNADEYERLGRNIK